MLAHVLVFFCTSDSLVHESPNSLFFFQHTLQNLNVSSSSLNKSVGSLIHLKSLPIKYTVVCMLTNMMLYIKAFLAVPLTKYYLVYYIIII